MIRHDIELRELQVFLTLAEELHFGRTGERLDLTPSRVSQIIRRLERKLGGELVHRTSRRVALTTLGERFRDEAGAAYEQLACVFEKTRASSRAFAGTLRLGLLSGPAGGPDLYAIADAFHALHPECEVDVIEVYQGDPFEQLRRGEVDLMATWLPHGQDDLTTGPVLTAQSRVLAVARDHPLAERDRVSVEDLADYAVARIDALPAALIPTKTPSGRPIHRQRSGGLDRPTMSALGTELAFLVARGTIVHPTVESVATYWGHPNIVYRPIEDLPPAKSALVWRRRVTNPRLREFARVAREVLRDRDLGGRA
jgi:DNA-binding transcriptional LysR family regulator